MAVATMNNNKQLKLFVISKAELCYTLGVCAETLERYFFDDDMLKKIGITRDEYKRRKRFYWHECTTIIKEFNL